MNATDGTTLGILAGGRASRLGGCDKAWLERDGTPLVVALARLLAPAVDGVLVSANAHPERHAAHGLHVVADRVRGIGPLGGLDALAGACRTGWLLTIPVDVVAIDGRVPQRLRTASRRHGAWACDDDGPQPLVALWHVPALREALAAAIASGEHAVHALQATLDMGTARFPGMRFGNLNTPGDLLAAGIAP